MTVPDGCDRIAPVGLVARRAGQTRTSALTTIGDCQFGGSIRVAAAGRWFLYAELHRGDQAGEVWLSVTTDQPSQMTEARQLYLRAHATASSRPLQIGVGVGIYTFGIALLVLALWQVLRTQPLTRGPHRSTVTGRV